MLHVMLFCVANAAYSFVNNCNAAFLIQLHLVCMKSQGCGKHGFRVLLLTVRRVSLNTIVEKVVKPRMNALCRSLKEGAHQLLCCN